MAFQTVDTMLQTLIDYHTEPSVKPLNERFTMEQLENYCPHGQKGLPAVELIADMVLIGWLEEHVAKRFSTKVYNLTRLGLIAGYKARMERYLEKPLAEVNVTMVYSYGVSNSGNGYVICRFFAEDINLTSYIHKALGWGYQNYSAYRLKVYGHASETANTVKNGFGFLTVKDYEW